MGRIGKHFLMIGVTLAMAGVIACGENPPPAPQPQVVKKKIAAQKAPSKASQTASGQPANVKPATLVTTSEPGEEKGADADATQVTPETSELVKASLQIAGGYDPKGRFDPFEPLFQDKPTAPVVASKDKRKKRIPQTPLERVSISQLKLSAIMRMSRGNSALVEDATGKGYVIKKGTYVGLNSGQVTRIDKDRVHIEEEIENVMGELIIQNTELKLQKPAGEL